jgi:hypothetical protein
MKVPPAPLASQLSSWREANAFGLASKYLPRGKDKVSTVVET